MLRFQLVADIARSAFGPWAGYTIAALIVWTAFASVFSLQLGYSRVPYAAARDGNYFRFLAAVHPRHGIPHRSLVALGLVGAFFCFFSLTQVIKLLVITRILLQFFPQQIGVILLRVQRPDLSRPYRMPLYPLPPLFATAGFGFLLVYRVHAVKELAVAAGIAVSGTTSICSAHIAWGNGRSPMHRRNPAWRTKTSCRSSGKSSRSCRFRCIQSTQPLFPAWT